VARWDGGAWPSLCEMLWFYGGSGREMWDWAPLLFEGRRCYHCLVAKEVTEPTLLRLTVFRPVFPEGRIRRDFLWFEYLTRQRPGRSVSVGVLAQSGVVPVRTLEHSLFISLKKTFVID
jgi:hypothetical protein